MAERKALWQRYRVLASTFLGLVTTIWVLGIPVVAAQSPPGVSTGPLTVLVPEINLSDNGDLGLPGDPPKGKAAKKGKKGKKGGKGGKGGKGKKGRVVSTRRFEGFGFDDNATENGGFRFIPPDPIGAAGKSRVIAVVNTMIESRTKGGTLKWGATA